MVQFGHEGNPDHSSLELIRNSSRRVAVAMPDPSEPGRERPEGEVPGTPAPDRLRRRVLARVRAEPEPVEPSAIDGLRRRIEGRRGRAVALTVLACVAIAALVMIAAGRSASPGSSAVAPGNGSASASLVRTGDRAELRLRGMPQPPIGETYEVWLTGPGGTPSPTNALFVPTTAGTAAVAVPGELHRVREITVTAEPRGGSSRPTSPVVLRVALTPGSGA